MHWKSISKSLWSKKPQKHPRRLAFRPSLEVLEGRQLLSVTSSVFVVDQPSSALVLSGDVGGYPIQQQGNGSLTSNYNGSIVAEWDLNALTINFPVGTTLNATISGSWQPLPGGGSGSADADYGGKVNIIIFTAKAALRDLVVTCFTANPLALSGTGPYSFPSTQRLTVLAGAADYNSPFGSGREDLAGLSGDNQSQTAGTFEDQGSGSYRLTVPVNLTLHAVVGGMQATLHIDGQIVANAVLPVVNLTDGSGPSFDYATSAVGGGGAVTTEDPAASITRTPQANLTSMTVTLTNHPDDTAEFLGYDLGGSGLSTSGYDPTTGQLVITGSADPSVYQNVLRTITYENDSPTPITDDRKIQFVVSDGTNSSVVRTTTVSVSGQFAPPGLWIVEQNLEASNKTLSANYLKSGFSPVITNVFNSSAGLQPPVGNMPMTLGAQQYLLSIGSDRAVSHSSGKELSVPLDRILAIDAPVLELPIG